MHHNLSVYVAIVLRIHLKNIVSISAVGVCVHIYVCVCVCLYEVVYVNMCVKKKALYVLCQSCKFFRRFKKTNETHRFGMIHHLVIAGLSNVNNDNQHNNYV